MLELPEPGGILYLGVVGNFIVSLARPEVPKRVGKYSRRLSTKAKYQTRWDRIHANTYLTELHCWGKRKTRKKKALMS